MGDSKNKAFKMFKSDNSKLLSDNISTGVIRPILLFSDLSFSPPTDVWETEDKICIMMEIAGLSLSNINVRYESGYLVIEGERKEPAVLKDKKIQKYHKKEIDYGIFTVKIKINKRVAQGNITANYKNGMLTIYLPKDEIKKTTDTQRVSVKII